MNSLNMICFSSFLIGFVWHYVQLALQFFKQIVLNLQKSINYYSRYNITLSFIQHFHNNLKSGIYVDSFCTNYFTGSWLPRQHSPSYSIFPVNVYKYLFIELNDFQFMLPNNTGNTDFAHVFAHTLISVALVCMQLH